MSTYTASILGWGHGSDAALRTTAAGLKAAVIGAGGVDNGDTGQINTSTVVRAAAGSYAGYQVFKLGDNGGSLTDYIVKVEYGSYSASQGTLALRWTFAKSTDGAGNVVGNYIQVTNMFGSATTDNPAAVYAAGDGSDFRFAISPGTENTSVYYAFSRTKDPTTGVKDDRGFQIIHRGVGEGQVVSAGGNQFQCFLNKDAVQVYSNWGLICGAPRYSSGSYKDGLALFPVWEPNVGTRRWDKSTIAYFTTDFNAPLVPIDLTDVYGATHTYLPLGFMPAKTAAINNSLNGNTTAHSVMMLWE